MTDAQNPESTEAREPIDDERPPIAPDGWSAYTENPVGDIGLSPAANAFEGGPQHNAPYENWTPYSPAHARGNQYPGSGSTAPHYPAIPGYRTPYLQGPPPETNSTSAIIVTVFAGLLLVSCYGTLIGIAPLVLGIVSINKGNAVAGYWYAGQGESAYAAVESARKTAMWAWISMGIGFLVELLAILTIGLLVVDAG